MSIEDNPLVSIIIPVYNSEKYVTECIESILNQSYQHFEIIIVDDSSSDQSYSICRKFAESYDNIHIFIQPHSGAGKARNLGIAKATGDYITFIDSDDRFDSTFLATMIKRSRKPDENGLVFCKVYEEYENGKQKIKNEPLLKTFEATSPDELFDMYCFPLIKGKIVSFCFRTLFPRKLIIENNCQFALCSYREDMIFMLQVAKHTRYFDVVNEPLLFYRRHPASLTGLKYIADYLSDSLKYFEYLNKEISTFHFSAEQKEKIIEWAILKQRNILIYHAWGGGGV